jgi:hypothetical protein
MSYSLKRGETISLNAVARINAGHPAPVTPPKVETTRDRMARNDLNAVHTAIRVFGVK